MNCEATPDGIEIELKLGVRDVDVARVGAALPDRADARGSRSLQNLYYDTPDGRLHRLGVAIRTRSVDGVHEMTVKQRRPDEGGLTERREWNVPLSSPQLDLETCLALPLPPEVQALLSQGALEVVFENRFMRTDWQLALGETVAMLSLDLGSVQTAHGGSVVSELELELVSGQRADLIALGMDLADQLPAYLAVISKAERGDRLLRGKPPQQDPLPTHRAGWVRRLSRLLDPLAGPAPVEAVAALRAIEDGEAWERFAKPLAAGQLPPGLARWMWTVSMEDHP